MEGEEPLLSQLNNGFKVGANIDVLANFQKVLIGLITKLEEEGSRDSPLGRIALVLLPVVFLQFKSSFELDFDSWNDVKENQFMEPFLANFNQLLEGMMGSDIETCLADRIELSEDADDSVKEIKMAIEFMHTLFEIFENMAADASAEFKLTIPNMVSGHAVVAS